MVLVISPLPTFVQKGGCVHVTTNQRRGEVWYAVRVEHVESPGAQKAMIIETDVKGNPDETDCAQQSLFVFGVNYLVLRMKNTCLYTPHDVLCVTQDDSRYSRRPLVREIFIRK